MGQPIFMLGDAVSEPVATTVFRFTRENGNAMDMSSADRCAWRREIIADLALCGLHKGGGGAAGAYALFRADAEAAARDWTQ